MERIKHCSKKRFLMHVRLTICYTVSTSVALLIAITESGKLKRVRGS